MKREKGITLVALVVTIIVLLILAGVSISMISGDDGIVEKASQASEKTKEATADEEQKMKDTVDYIDSKVQGNNGNVDSEDETEILNIHQKLYIYRPNLSGSGLTPTQIQILGEPDNEQVIIYKTNDVLTIEDIQEIKENNQAMKYCLVNQTTPVKYLDKAVTYYYVWVEYEDGKTTNVLRFNVSEILNNTEQENYGTVVE